MKTIDSYVKKWYDAVEEGAFLATRCPDCGAVEFPPMPICNSCGCHEMEWIEISGEGELYAFDDCSAPIWGPELGPVISGLVRLNEGTCFQAFVLGAEGIDRDELIERLPIKVTMEAQQRDGFMYPAVRLAE